MAREEKQGEGTGAERRERRPLEGKVVLVTRSRGQAEGLARALEEAGASVEQLPTIEIAPPDSWESADAVLRNLTPYRAIVFASANGARYFCSRCGELSIDLGRVLKGIEIFAVGRVTAEALESSGVGGTVVTGRADGKHLADLIRRRVNPGSRILLPGGRRGRSSVAPTLRGESYDVVEVQVYQNRLPRSVDPGPVGARLEAGGIDAIAFFSPSSVFNLKSMIPVEVWRAPVLAAIGPTTAEALLEVGCPADLVSEEQTAAGFVLALASYFDSSKERRGAPHQNT
jgi:uroporphyrinogen III methyltransferase/synthase